MSRPLDETSVRAAIFDVLETYFGEWWTVDLLALRTRRKTQTVQQEIHRLCKKKDHPLRTRMLHGRLHVMLPNRSYLGGSDELQR